jgi:Mrp family chromosome partitioning ATPase
MFARNKQQPVISDDALILRSLSGKTICEFSGETVANMRRLLTSLMYQATMPKSIANVAALREEGVTYITLAMAAVLASDVNATVCAVELNWWHPSMHLYLAGQTPVAIENGKQKKSKSAPAESVAPSQQEGLGAVLRGTTPLAQALVGTSLSNLSVLPAGYVPAEARSALARSTQLRSTIEALAEQFDYLIFDIPAVAATSDTVALTSLASAVAIVVRQGVTPSNTVKMALDEVKHVPVLGVILNQVQIYTPRWILNLLPQE